MKQIVVISGKGGTGKTTVVAGWASLAGSALVADCDVDAPNLHILLKPEILEEGTFTGLPGASLDAEVCTGCGLCFEHCHFNAISNPKPGVYEVDDLHCEGCGFCSSVCPVEAIEMVPAARGHWYISSSRLGPFVHARLAPAQENSGKLVSEVKQKAKVLAERKQVDYLLVDGAPGIGCSVIASLAGADLVVAVAEPTLSGVGDLDRVLELAAMFDLPTGLLINKYDLNLRLARTLARRCARPDGPTLLGKLPFDPAVPMAMANLQTIIEYGESPAAHKLTQAWDNLTSILCM